MEGSMDMTLSETPTKGEQTQQLYELRKNLQMHELMEKEYLADIELLKKKHHDDLTAERIKLKTLEEKNVLELRELLNKIDLMEQEKKAETEEKTKMKIEKDEKVKELEQRLQQLSDMNNSALLQQLKVENEELMMKISGLCEECLILKEKNTMYAKREEELNETLSELKELYASQKEDLASHINTGMGLRDEIAILKTELEMLKSKPQSCNQKGNSLFAEVEDKRQSMKKSLENAANKYRQMKKQYMEKCAEASKYRAEFVFLSRKLEQIETAMKKEDEDLINSYKSRIKTLEEELESLSKKKPPYIIANADNAALKFIEVYAESSRKECEKLKSELETQSVKALFSSETLHNVQRQLHRVEVDLIQARGKVCELEGQLQEKEKKPDE